MDKEQMFCVLQACVLAVDEVSLNNLTEVYGIDPIYAEIGYKLYLYLKSKQIERYKL